MLPFYGHSAPNGSAPSQSEEAAVPTIRDATEADLSAILAITNQAIAETTAVWNNTLATLEARTAWLKDRQGRGFPVLVAQDGGEVLGFASFGDFRPFEGYLHTVEHSIYVAPGAQRRGIGAALLAELVARAQAMGKHVIVGGIEAGNAGSLALHRRAGFVEVGRLPQVGRKFGRWLDLVFMQKTLDDAG
jgi:phosphinothricin acetyltransferase